VFCQHSKEISSTQLETLDFPGGGLRQLGDELDPARIFIRREMGFDMVLERCR
jgi:hypothetical protein